MMKRFKFGLVGLLLGLFGFTCFSSAGYNAFENYSDYLIYSGDTLPNMSYRLYLNSNSLFCFSYENVGGGGSVEYPFLVNDGTCSSYSRTFTNKYVNICSVSCGSNPRLEFGVFSSSRQTMHNIRVYQFTGETLPEIGGSCPECATCPTTGDILSGSCDTNYCVQNDLCPVASNYSQLFINEIEHESAPLINITIPQEYDWDSSIMSGVFDLTISGQNVDYEYIDGIIRTQSSKPNSTDFNNIVSGLIPLLVPGLVVIFFIWFIFRFIKKIF